METITRVGVVGLGTMGAGIAQVLLEGGCEVIGRDVDDAALERARARIEAGLARRVEKGLRSEGERDAALARLTLTTGLPALAGCELVIEAIAEEIGAKRELFAALDGICGGDAVLATNTSAISVTAIAAAGALPERCLGLHFFNPAPLMPLVEAVRAERTADAPYEAACELIERCGKQVVRCNDTPGFVVNRLLVPALNDAVRALDELGVSGRRDRRGDDRGRRLADGPVPAHRPGRHRRPRARGGGAARRAARAPHGAAAAAAAHARRGPSGAQDGPGLL